MSPFFPMTSDMCCQALEQPQVASTDAPRRSILIVDDDVDQTEVLETRLVRQGYRAIVAHDGHAGLAKARQYRPDLVLLDIGLPDANGLSVCAELDDAPETAGTPIIILSGMEGPDIVRKSRAAGGRYYVRKPFDPNALLVLIEQEIGASDDLTW